MKVEYDNEVLILRTPRYSLTVVYMPDCIWECDERCNRFNVRLGKFFQIILDDLQKT